MYTHRFIISILFVVVLFLLGIRTSRLLHAQSEVSQLVLTNIETEQFPDISIQLQALDGLGSPVANLTTHSFQVSENDVPVTVASLESLTGGIQVHFIIDAGASLNSVRWDYARNELFNFMTTQFNESLDLVALTAVEHDGVKQIVPFSSSMDEIITAIAQYAPPGGAEFSDPLPAISDVLDDFASTADNSKAHFIVFFTAAIERQSYLSETIDKANEKDIPIYTVFVNSFLSSSSEQTVRQLAIDTGGVFSPYQRSGSMNNAYTQFMAFRQQFRLTYRSTSAISGTRVVDVSINNQASSNIAYNVLVDAPIVSIVEPNSGTPIERKAITITQAYNDTEPTSETVTAWIDFPDGYERSTRTATLLVDNQPVFTVNQPMLNRAVLHWDLSSLEISGATVFVLNVEVTDELGLTSKSFPTLVTINLIVHPEPIHTRNPEDQVLNVESGCGLPQAFCFIQQFIRDGGVFLLVMFIVFMLAFFFVWRKEPWKKIRSYKNVVLSEKISNEMTPIKVDTIVTFPEKLAFLRNQLVQTFSKGELQSLCFDLGVAYDDLPGETRTALAQELVVYCYQRDRVSELLDICRALRPHVIWQ